MNVFVVVVITMDDGDRHMNTFQDFFLKKKKRKGKLTYLVGG